MVVYSDKVNTRLLISTVIDFFLNWKIEDFGICLTSEDIIIAISNMISQYIQKRELKSH